MRNRNIEAGTFEEKELMKFYKLSFDMNQLEENTKNENNTIYAETTNIDEIVYKNIKKGFFDNIILAPRVIDSWPDVEFYYSSKAFNREGEYLLNVKRWPIVHISVMEEFVKKEINGLQFFPIKLIDVVTQDINANYVVMYIKNFIDAFDMEKSKYKYNEKYDFYTFIPKETYLNKSICSEYDIFRCSKSVATIYVSEKIKKIAEDNHWTGFSFYEQK